MEMKGPNHRLVEGNPVAMEDFFFLIQGREYIFRNKIILAKPEEEEI